VLYGGVFGRFCLFVFFLAGGCFSTVYLDLSVLFEFLSLLGKWREFNNAKWGVGVSFV
jgi:hypothetical protein